MRRFENGVHLARRQMLQFFFQHAENRLLFAAGRIQAPRHIQSLLFNIIDHKSVRRASQPRRAMIHVAAIALRVLFSDFKKCGAVHAHFSTAVAEVLFSAHGQLLLYSPLRHSFSI